MRRITRRRGALTYVFYIVGDEGSGGRISFVNFLSVWGLAISFVVSFFSFVWFFLSFFRLLAGFFSSLLFSF